MAHVDLVPGVYIDMTVYRQFKYVGTFRKVYAGMVNAVGKLS